MARTALLDRPCKRCSSTYTPKDYRQKFCSHSCAALSNNACKAAPTKETKAKVSASLKRWWTNNPHSARDREALKKQGRASQQGKNDPPKSILDVSKRTTAKILRRMNLACSHCGWDQDICDIHHIRGRKIPDADNHSNLTYICPNCHRLAHKGKIKSEDLVDIADYIGDRWIEHYYG